MASSCAKAVLWRGHGHVEGPPPRRVPIIGEEIGHRGDAAGQFYNIWTRRRCAIPRRSRNGGQTAVPGRHLSARLCLMMSRLERQSQGGTRLAACLPLVEAGFRGCVASGPGKRPERRRCKPKQRRDRMTYIDGFVMAVPSANRDKFKKHAEETASVLKEKGALKIMECWGDDVPDGQVTSFPWRSSASRTRRWYFPGSSGRRGMCAIRRSKRSWTIRACSPIRTRCRSMASA